MRPQNIYALAALRISKIAILSALFITQGCTITNIQQVEVDATPLQQAIRVTEQPDSGELFARGYLSWSQDDPLETQIEGHTDVNQNGLFEVEPILDSPNRFIERQGVNVQRFRGDNFAWNTPQWQGGLELEWQPTSPLALVGGLGFSEIDGRSQISQNVGLGLLFGSETVAARLDFGMSFYQSRYLIEAVQGHEESFRGDMTRTITLVEIEERDQYNNMTFGFTLNSRNPGNALNYFFNYTTGRQTFYDVSDEFFFLEGGQQRQFEYRYTEGYNAFAAGLFTSMRTGGRFLFGARFTKYNDEMDQLSFFNFFVQYDVRLF